MLHFNRDMKLKIPYYGSEEIQQLAIDFSFKVIIKHLLVGS